MTIPLFRVPDVRRAGGDDRELRDRARRGELVRVRRGVYAPAGEWKRLSPVERHVVNVEVVASELRGPFLVAGPSAAALHRIPAAAGWPAPVTIMVPWRGGGASEVGVTRTAEGWSTARRVFVGGLPVTTVERTVFDIARRSAPDDGIALIDWVRSRRRERPVSADDLEREWRRAGVRRGAARFGRMLASSTDLSDSWGESRARLAILRCGFDPPELQVEFSDQQGRMVVDFFWPSVSIAGEFDGHVKYSGSAGGGDDPADVVWREKQREDRLRRHPAVAGLVRIIHDDVLNPARLAGLLADSGVPRVDGRPRSSADGRARTSAEPRREP